MSEENSDKIRQTGPVDYSEIYNRNRIEWMYQAARSPKLGATAVRVGLLFATFVQPETRETLNPGYKWVMENAHIKSRETMANALHELEDAGFLEIKRYTSYRSHYKMPFDGNEIWDHQYDNRTT